MMWTRVPLPSFPGPVWGFDFPVEGRFHVATAQGFFEICLTPEPEARVLIGAEEFRQIYDPETDDGFEWGGRWFEVNGPNGPCPTLLDLPTGERITGDPRAGRLLITDPTERVVH